MNMLGGQFRWLFTCFGEFRWVSEFITTSFPSSARESAGVKKKKKKKKVIEMKVRFIKNTPKTTEKKTHFASNSYSV